jgi:flavin reductase (DIM6/NTAB) family NADH-FMN oxidoreductase RutF
MQKKSDVKSALSRKYPEQVVLVTTRGKKGNANVMAVGWVAQASDDPVMFMLGIDDGAYTFKLIRETREFVVAFPNEAMGKQVLFAGTCHGKGRDKIAEAKLAVQEADKVRAPLIADAVANFECKLAAIHRPGNCPLVFGRVVAAHENIDKKIRRLYTVGKDYRMAGVKAAKRAGG